MNRSTLLRGFLSTALFLAALTPAFAQGTTGSVNGTVTDNSGAVLPGVTVTATGPAVMGVQTAVTNEQGQYRFPTLPPGTYRLEYQLAGFGTVVRDQIVVSIGFTATINVQLQVATLNETVTVTGASPVVDTQNTNIQTNFTQEMIKSLPNARDIWALIAVAPGDDDELVRRRRVARGHADWLFRLRPRRSGARAGRRRQLDGRHRRHRLLQLRRVRRSVDRHRLERRVDADAGRADQRGGEVRRQPVPRRPLHRLPARLDAGDERHRRASGARGSAKGTRITKYYDPNLGIGGPIKRDKVWYFVSLRNQFSGSNIGGFPVEDPGTFEFKSQLENLTEKTTYQLSQNNKMSQFIEMRRKLQPSRDASSTRYQDAVYKQESISSYGTVEWNSVVSPAFFMNTRFSSWGYNWPNYAYGPDGLQRRHSAAPHRAGDRQRRRRRARGQTLSPPLAVRLERHASSRTSCSAATTAFKWGSPANRKRNTISTTDSSTNTRAMFDSAAGQGDFFAPWRVQIGNTPRMSTNNIAHSARSSRTRSSSTRRLTVNAGFRWDYYHVYYPDRTIREGAFRDFFYAGAPLPNGYSVPASFPTSTMPGQRRGRAIPGGIRAALRHGVRSGGRWQDGAEGELGPLSVESGPAELRQSDPEPDRPRSNGYDCRKRRRAGRVRRGAVRRRQFDVNELGTFVEQRRRIVQHDRPRSRSRSTPTTSQLLRRARADREPRHPRRLRARRSARTTGRKCRSVAATPATAMRARSTIRARRHRRQRPTTARRLWRTTIPRA